MAETRAPGDFWDVPENTQFTARVQHKRDTASNFTSNNPKILSGEIIVVDTGSGTTRLKVGNGSNFNSLPYLDEPIYNKITELPKPKVLSNVLDIMGNYTLSDALTEGTTVDSIVDKDKVSHGIKASALATEAINSIPTASASARGLVKIGTNISVSDGTISVPDASTSAKGVVQLSSSTSSSSTTLAATASAVKSAYDLANAALPKTGGNVSGNVLFTGGTVTVKTEYGLMFYVKNTSTTGFAITCHKPTLMILESSTQGQSVNIRNVAAPIDALDAANKSYVDGKIDEAINAIPNAEEVAY